LRKIIGISLTSVFLLTAADAMAQQAALRRVCGAEIERHCPGVQPGEGRIRTCVEQHFAEFSQPCKQALLQSVAVVKACKTDVQQTCSGIEPGGGRIQACMKDHIAEYSEACKRAIATAKFGNR
jgi:hypothetical protein